VRYHQNVFVDRQRLSLEVAMQPKRQVDEREVEVAFAQQGNQLFVTRGIGQDHLDVRSLANELAQDVRQQMRRDCLIRANPELRRIPDPDELCFGDRKIGLDRPGMDEQARAGLRERQGLRDARTVHKSRTHDALERCQLLADRGLRVAEPARTIDQFASGSGGTGPARCC
jgi:hypothetical protein